MSKDFEAIGGMSYHQISNLVDTLAGHLDGTIDPKTNLPIGFSVEPTIEEPASPQWEKRLNFMASNEDDLAFSRSTQAALLAAEDIDVDGEKKRRRNRRNKKGSPENAEREDVVEADGVAAVADGVQASSADHVVRNEQRKKTRARQEGRDSKFAAQGDAGEGEGVTTATKSSREQKTGRVDAAATKQGDAKMETTPTPGQKSVAASSSVAQASGSSSSIDGKPSKGTKQDKGGAPKPAAVASAVSGTPTTNEDGGPSLEGAKKRRERKDRGPKDGEASRAPVAEGVPAPSSAPKQPQQQDKQPSDRKPNEQRQQQQQQQKRMSSESKPTDKGAKTERGGSKGDNRSSSSERQP